MKKLLIANFKMNLTPSQAKEYLINFISRVDQSKNDIVLCLPFTNLSIGKYLIEGTSLKLGAQNLSDEENGSFTGEISAKMLKDSGANIVIVGHSERRIKFKENNKLINKKIKTGLKNNLTLVLCVGESLVEKNTLKTLETLKVQLEEGLKGLYENELENIIIAYEPIWAIGTGKTAQVKEIEFAVKAIRKVLSEDFSEKAGRETRVVYGGSINPKNLPMLAKTQGINGFLVGGACLEPNNLVLLNSIL